MNRNSPHQPIAGSGGLASKVRGERDPYEDLDDLMTVVEALCPTWPERPIISGTGTWLL